MADVIAQLFVDKLTSLLQEEANLLGGVRQDAQYIRDELERMTAFLRDVDARQLTEGNDSLLKVWVSQVRDVAYDIEDVLDEFILRLQHHHNVQGFYGSLRRIGCFVKKLKARHQIASQIRSLKVRVRDIAEGNQRYRLEGKSLQQSSSSNIDAARTLNAVQGEADLVGIEKHKQQLVAWLLNKGSKLQCISVVGMGGSGKTTLVKKVYDDPSVKNHFQSHLWVVVSQSLNLVELLREIVQQLSNKIEQPLPQGVESMSVNRLKEIIDDILQQRRFLLVIDDIWSISDWEDVRNIVPVNDCGSRLMLTTRKIDVASEGEYTLNLKPLSQEESWTLFCRKAFPRSRLCPPHLQAISDKILSRCEGLPLAIVVIAGVLATKDESRVEEWKRFEQSLPSMWGIDDRLERVKKLLFLSYYDLPYHLKICFLYMSLFPEDEKMEKMRLIRLWIAEGFVQARPRMSIEDVAEEYLKELINRSLVQVGDIGSLTGRLKTCRLHDLLREMILSIATEHKFIMVASGSSYEWPEIVRRLAIHEDDDNWQVSSKYFTRLRSFLLFGHDHFTFMSKLHQSILVSSKFLKVLDFRKARLRKIPPEIFKLVHLRYLSLRNTKVRTIPKLIGNLEKLETLDLKFTDVARVPKEIVRLVRLRHLLVGNEFRGVKVPSNIGALFSLQKLLGVDVSENGEEVLREIGRLSELRKLGILGLRREHGMTLCSSLSKLTNLCSLDLSSSLPKFTRLPIKYSSSRGEGELNVNSLPTLPFLEKIRLQGSIDKALNCKSFPSLITLKLLGCKLMDRDSLCFKAGGFQRLTHLIIWGIYGLKTVTIEEGAMPHLDTLLIVGCELLDVVPFGIEHLTKLRRLQLYNMPKKVIDGCKDKEHRDYWRIAHIPQVEIDQF